MEKWEKKVSQKIKKYKWGDSWQMCNGNDKFMSQIFSFMQVKTYFRREEIRWTSCNFWITLEFHPRVSCVISHILCAKQKKSFQALVTILLCNAHEKAFEHNFLFLSILCLVSHHIHVRPFYCFQSHYWQTQELFLKNILLHALFGNNLAVCIFALFTKLTSLVST